MRRSALSAAPREKAKAGRASRVSDVPAAVLDPPARGRSVPALPG